MDLKKVLQLLGLAAKAGKVASGEFSVKKAVQERKAFLVFVAEDASDRTKKLFHDKCGYYRIPVREIADKAALGAAIGRGERSSAACTDPHFADGLLQALDRATMQGTCEKAPVKSAARRQDRD